ncbi:MAG: LD-carboxypeptidase, partial [Bacteroidetes bacterium]|nr:LD-carboxypeptidase [Bacteroidota bacterium]
MLKKIQSLKTGDEIAIVSTARKINKDEIALAIKLFESWGLIVKLGNTIGLAYHQFAGTDQQRAMDFQQMLDNKNIKAIICARGGYGTVRILDFLDFTQFNLNPKWIVGYSDVTILHAHINTYLGYQTLHATMPINFENNTKESINSLKSALFGKTYHINFKTRKESILANTEGIIVGGNLSILYSILGTKSGINTDNKILFIEDLDEYLYHIDRMMMALKRAGKLSKLKALLVGGMTKMNDNTIPYGKTAEEIVLEHSKEFGYPVIFDVPAGHITDNRALIFKKKVKIECENDKVK